MAEHIPFINSATDCELAALYSDSEYLRVSLMSWDRISKKIPDGPGLWIDGGVDGYGHGYDAEASWNSHIGGFSESSALWGTDTWRKPEKIKVRSFCESVLEGCAALDPALISVPQLPQMPEGATGVVNRLLADCAGDWIRETAWEGELVLPVIFTHQKQLNLATDNARHLQHALSNTKRSRASFVWSVDSTLPDQDGSPTFQERRFPGLLDYHKRLRDKLNDKVSLIAGPYWGINLVLWARALVDYPAIGLGAGYQYHLAGGQVRTPHERIAIGPLRRWAVRSTELEDWLEDVLEALPTDWPSYGEFETLKKGFGRLGGKRARRQVAAFYKSWFDTISGHSSMGRALGLYQDLSSAYVTGKQLPKLPRTEKTARLPHRVAEQYMLSCL